MFEIISYRTVGGFIVRAIANDEVKGNIESRLLGRNGNAITLREIERLDCRNRRYKHASLRERHDLGGGI